VKKFYTLALCAALGVASQAQAAGIFSRSGPEERLPSGWELGVGIGSHVHTETFQDFNFFDTSSTSYKLFAGYRFNRYFTVEAAYIDGGDGTETYVNDLGETVLSIESSTRGFQGSVLGSLPLGASAFSLFGRIGVLDWKQDVATRDFVALTEGEATADGNDVFWGGGLMAALDSALLRLEYEYVEFDTDDDDFGAKSEVISLSVAWIF
jgi:opacity protein-like surface antigen